MSPDSFSPNSLGQALEQLITLQAYISKHCQELQSENDLLRSACAAGGFGNISARMPVSSRRFPETLVSPPLQPLKEQSECAHFDDTLHASLHGFGSNGQPPHATVPGMPKSQHAALHDAHSPADEMRVAFSCAPSVGKHPTAEEVLSKLRLNSSDTLDSPEPPSARHSSRSVGSSIRIQDSAGSHDHDVKRSQKELVRKTLAIDHTQETFKRYGISQEIVRSKYFDRLSNLLVCSNMFWIAIDADLNDSKSLYAAHPVFIIVANLFCIAFLSELTVRLTALTHLRYVLRDKMNLIDGFCVTCLVLETWVIPVVQAVAGANSSIPVGDASILRMVRLVRLARIATVTKMLRSMPELLMIIESMKAALRAVALTLAVLTLLLFLFAVAFRLLSVDSELDHTFFRSVPVSMYNLLVYGVLSLDEVGPIASRLEKVNVFLPVLFFAFVLLVACCVMNMLIGVMCEVVKEASRLLEEKIQVESVTGKVSKMLADLTGTNGMSTNGNGQMRISKDDLFYILGNRAALVAFQEMGTDVYALVDWADSLFWDPIAQREKELTVPEFMQVVMNLRASKLATVKHILNLEKVVQRNTDLIMSALERVQHETGYA